MLLHQNALMYNNTVERLWKFVKISVIVGIWMRLGNLCKNLIPT